MANEGIIEKLSRYSDYLARWSIAAIMAMVMVNVILRLAGYPLKGTLEFVQIFSALAIGLSLANCAVHGGHIAVTLLVDKFPPKVQVAVDFLMELIAFVFLMVGAWQLYLQAAGSMQSGEVGMTTGMPFYPFIGLIAIGFLLFALVVLKKMVAAFSKKNIMIVGSPLSDVIAANLNAVRKGD